VYVEQRAHQCQARGVCAGMYVCMHICMVCMYVRTYVRTYVCMHVCIYVSRRGTGQERSNVRVLGV
jgi:hypothetical protein